MREGSKKEDAAVQTSILFCASKVEENQGEKWVRRKSVCP